MKRAARAARFFYGSDELQPRVGAGHLEEKFQGEESGMQRTKWMRLAGLLFVLSGPMAEAQDHIEAGIFGELILRAEPIIGNIFNHGIGLGLRAGKAADEIPL